MRTLRARLLVGTAVGTGLVLSGSAAALYALISGRLWTEFDEALRSKARSLAALVEQDGDVIELELDEDSLPEFKPSDRAEYYQLWTRDGDVISRSSSLDGGDLPHLRSDTEQPVYRTTILPDGRAGRIIGLTFVPRQEELDDPDDRPGERIQTTLVVARDTADISSTLAQLRWLLIFGCGAAILAAVGVLSWFVRRGLRPMGRIAADISAIGPKDLSARLKPDDVPGELAPVVQHLNGLLGRLEAAFAREKAFTADVAHELRTPLAGLRTTMEVSLTKTRDAAEHRTALADALAIAEQMTQMIENLLELARADAGQVELAREEVDLVSLVKERFAQFDQRVAERSLRVEWRVPESCRAVVDPAKFGIVLNNLFDNATSYADPREDVRIELSSDNGLTRLRVSNGANGLSRGDGARVFERYWRGDAARSARGHNRHYGLGLPLSKQLVILMGGEIEVAIDDQSRFEVSLTLPRAK